MISLLGLVGALLVPPHGRFNSRCFPIWSTEKKDVTLVWGSDRFSPKWGFTTEVSTNSNDSQSDSHVQRIWCTDSGVAGFYRLTNGAADVALSFRWILGPSELTTFVLRGESDDPLAVTAETSENAPGTLLVAGDLLYFYTWSGLAVLGSLPRLSVLQFSEYQEGVAVTDLYRLLLSSFDVIGYASQTVWNYQASPIYPSGPAAVTVSVQCGVTEVFAVDAALTVAVAEGAATPERALRVYANSSDFPSANRTFREFVTVPGYACRASSDPSPGYCRRLAAGDYSWSGAVEQLGISFADMAAEPNFTLPAGLWVPRHEVAILSVLASYGQSSTLAFSGDRLFAVETRANTSCSSRKHYVLVTYDATQTDANGTLAPSTVSRSIACSTTAVYPLSNDKDVPYEATSVKWLGPFGENPLLMVATSVTRNQYAGLNMPTINCGDGEYGVNETCDTCPAGHFCRNGTSVPCAPGTFQNQTGQAECAVCDPGLMTATLKRPDKYVREGASACVPCPDGYECPAGGQQPKLCGRGLSCSGGRVQMCERDYGVGAAECQPCPRDRAWYLGRCRSCITLPHNYVCNTHHEGSAEFNVVVDAPPPKETPVLDIVLPSVLSVLIFGGVVGIIAVLLVAFHRRRQELKKRQVRAPS